MRVPTSTTVPVALFAVGYLVRLNRVGLPAGIRGMLLKDSGIRRIGVTQRDDTQRDDTQRDDTQRDDVREPERIFDSRRQDDRAAFERNRGEWRDWRWTELRAQSAGRIRMGCG